MGIMHLENQDGMALTKSELALAHNITSQIALAMAGIKLRETLRSLSVRDSLTGLFNRHYMEESLQRELANAQRKQRPLALVMMDLDFFKSFNDVFGHDAGDLLLTEVGSLLGSKLRSTDIACRFGGEEFVIIMPDTGLEGAARVAERIRNNVAGSPFRVSDGKDLLTVTISVGVAATLGEGDTPQALLKRADEAVYEAKAQGRNKVCARAA